MIDLFELETLLIEFAREAHELTNGDMQSRATAVAQDIINRCY